MRCTAKSLKNDKLIVYQIIADDADARLRHEFAYSDESMLARLPISSWGWLGMARDGWGWLGTAGVVGYRWVSLGIADGRRVVVTYE